MDHYNFFVAMKTSQAIFSHDGKNGLIWCT